MRQISTKNMIHEDKISAQVGKKNTILNRANFKTSPFAQYLRQAQILILEILNVFLWLKFSPSLILNPAVSGKHFETASITLNRK
jgi:hypothetical protein